MSERKSLERAMGDRLYEMSRSTGCAADALFHRLHTLDGATIDTEHDYIIGAIRAAVSAVGAHESYARDVIGHIEREKRRAEQNVIDMKSGERRGPIRLSDGVVAD